MRDISKYWLFGKCICWRTYIHIGLNCIWTKLGDMQKRPIIKWCDIFCHWWLPIVGGIWEFISVPQDILNARLVMLRNLFIDLSIRYCLASKEVILHLVNVKYAPALLYGLDACHINISDKWSLDFVFTHILMKLFKTSSINIIDEMFNLKHSLCLS